jgi:hypothetical protein
MLKCSSGKDQSPEAFGLGSRSPRELSDTESEAESLALSGNCESPDGTSPAKGDSSNGSSSPRQLSDMESEVESMREGDSRDGTRRLSACSAGSVVFI